MGLEATFPLCAENVCCSLKSGLVYTETKHSSILKHYLRGLWISIPAWLTGQMKTTERIPRLACT